MITYQEHNTKSPLNGLAAKWAAENPHLLPVDSTEIAPPSQVESEQLAPISIASGQPLEPGSQAEQQVANGPSEDQTATPNAETHDGETHVKPGPDMPL